MIKSIKEIIPEWLNRTGPFSDIVFLSTVSLYRNIRGYKFERKTDDKEKEELLQFLKDGVKATGKFMNIMDLNEMDIDEKEFLWERLLITDWELKDGKYTGIAVNNKQNNVIIMNSREHLCLTSIASGLDIMESYRDVDRIDDMLNEEFHFMFDEELGFLTSTIDRVGTGLEVDVLIHLPALVITGQVSDLVDELEESHYLMEGTFRDGGGIEGSFFSIKNQYTLGRTEEEIIEDMQVKIKDAIKREIDAREYLLENARYETEDKIWRSYGILTNARFLNIEDFLNLSSAVRLGIGMGTIKDISIETLNRMLISLQPGHIRILEDYDIDEREENIMRASILRKNVGGK